MLKKVILNILFLMINLPNENKARFCEPTKHNTEKNRPLKYQTTDASLQHVSKLDGRKHKFDCSISLHSFALSAKSVYSLSYKTNRFCTAELSASAPRLYVDHTLGDEVRSSCNSRLRTISSIL